MVYKTHGTCSQLISFELGGRKNSQCLFYRRLRNGNLKGISALVEGMDAKEAIAKLEGIQCGFKNTSCPDQLAKALKQAL